MHGEIWQESVEESRAGDARAKARDAAIGPIRPTSEKPQAGDRDRSQRSTPCGRESASEEAGRWTQEARRSTEIIGTANQVFTTEGMPILTVGDSDDFINAGGIIRFTELGQRVRFEINPDAAERVSLRISSRLLRVADIARPRPRAGTP